MSKPRPTIAGGLWLVAVCVLPAAAGLGATEPRRDGMEFFEQKVRPVLAERCYSCHSARAKKLRGGLRLDTWEGISKGGDLGPAVVPGNPDESLLLEAVRYHDKDLRMPPAGKLPDAVVADLETWVNMGAPYPAGPSATGTDATATAPQDVVKSRRGWWSLLPVRRPSLPAVRDAAWPDDRIDRFVLAGLEAAGLEPAGPADPRTMIRRLSLVLTGLPPTPAQVDAFLVRCAREAAPGEAVPRAALERLVDELIASPHFGEQWARHWLDVVRFTETHGNEWNYEVHHAWRYRDYLVRALNADVPYDRLILEHVAGDLLPEPRKDPREGFNESVIGTAFFRFGEVNHDDCIGLPQIGYDIADNQVDTLTKAFQATTVACARCHDHKLDAVTTRDYHALLGVVRSARMVSHTIDPPEAGAPALRRLGELKRAIRQQLGEAWLREARDAAPYLLAARARRARPAEAARSAGSLDPERLERWAKALAAEKTPLEDVLEPWRLVSGSECWDPPAFAAAWTALADRYAREDRTREAESSSRFDTFADFRDGEISGWQAGGLGLREPPSRPGDLVVEHRGDRVVRAILPAGCFSHRLSDRLNGTLRSPLLPAGGKAHLSFQVMGRRSSAVRLVTNNCQLNYKNYRALTSDSLQWVTFDPPRDGHMRVYAELMTMLDNPKFPDQLSALGGDPANYRVPWEKAAEDPRSYFGVTRAVFHDGPEPPKPELGHFRPLFADRGPATPESVAAQYARELEAAVQAWADDRATDDDVRWLCGLLGHGLLGNNLGLTPGLEPLVAEYRRVEATLATPRVVPGLCDFGPGFDQPVLGRGDPTKPGEPVARRYLEALAGPGDRFADPGSGRLELAGRIASPENPLTARVMVNRVWHHLFGSGLVPTVDDFGHLGERPSHPELLDDLAVRLVDDGWSLKRTVRAIVLSRTFRTEGRPSAAARQADPQNRLLQHYPARRLEAEGIRDAILAASGTLDRRLFGPSVAPYRDKPNAERRLFPGPVDGEGRRSLYIKNCLMETPRFLGAFDLPMGKMTQGRRYVTHVPAQALALLNDPFVVQQADAWARRLGGDDPAAGHLDPMFRVALGRPPGDDERARFRRAIDQLVALRSRGAEAPSVWKEVAHVIFNMGEFSYIP